jgi:HK97 family phage major capsid protein
MKSIDAPLLAAAGQGQSRVTTIRPGAAGDRKPVKQLESAKMAKKTLAEQISAFEATRQAKAARMQEIMDEAGEKGETLDTAQTEEYDGLQNELKSVDEHLVRMRALDKANAAAARPVDGSSSQAGGESRSRGGAHVTSMKRALPPGIAFARYVKCLIAARGVPASALAIAEHQYPDMGDLHLVLRAAVAAGTTTDATWASGLVQYQDLANEFIEFLRPATIIGKFGTGGIPALRAIPFNVRVPRQTSGGDAYWVGEGQPKPLTSFDFDTLTLRWAKVANIAVITDELARFSSPAAEALVRDALRDALVARIDLTFVDPAITAIADTRPASITNGRTPVTASGTDSAAVRADVQELFGNFIANNLSPASGVWIMNSTTALALSMMRNALDQNEFPDITMNGGTFIGLPVITSQHLAAAGSPPTSNIILVNASDIYLADDGQVMIDASREASLQMDDAPTNASTSGSPATPTPTTMVSMFQTNSIAIRAERYINWARRRDAAVEYISGAAYAA